VSFIATPYDELALVVRQPTEDFSYTAFLAYDGDDVVAEGMVRRLPAGQP
jgi:hypothetical protein